MTALGLERSQRDPINGYAEPAAVRAKSDIHGALHPAGVDRDPEIARAVPRAFVAQFGLEQHGDSPTRVIFTARKDDSRG